MRARVPPGPSRARPVLPGQRFLSPRWRLSEARGRRLGAQTPSPRRRLDLRRSRRWVASKGVPPVARAYPACTTDPGRPRRRTRCSTRARGAAPTPTRAHPAFSSCADAPAATDESAIWKARADGPRARKTPNENAFRAAFKHARARAICWSRPTPRARRSRSARRERRASPNPAASRDVGIAKAQRRAGGSADPGNALVPAQSALCSSRARSPPSS